jgi:glycosyltransferase involved in cell wall biosynthesis
VLPAEVIVVDDGSRDGTADRLQVYSQQIRYIYQDNQGVACARNRGVGEARGEYIAFLDADDFWHPLKLELQVVALTQSPGLGLLGTVTFDWPGNLPKFAAAPEVICTPVSWERLVVKNSLTTSSLLVRRDVLERAGPFDQRLQGPEDYDLWLRVLELVPGAILRLPLTGYRSVPGSLSKQAGRMEADMLAILGKLDARNAWHNRRWLRRKAYSYCRYSCAYMHGAAGGYAAALRNLCQSFGWYPLPYRRDEVRMSLARPRLLAVSLLRLMRSAWASPSASPAVSHSPTVPASTLV